MPSSDPDAGKGKAPRKGMGDGPPRLKPPTQLKFSFFPEENHHKDVRAYLMQFLATDAEDWDESPAQDGDEDPPGISAPKSLQGKKGKGGRGTKGKASSPADAQGKKGKGGGKKGKSSSPSDDDSAKFLCPMCGSPFTEDDTSCPNCGKFFD